MVLIIGGAYQGKRAYAMEAYGLAQEQVFSCTQGPEIDFSKACVDNLAEFTYGCVLRGEDPRAYFEARRQLWRDSILICADISCGVVPLEPENRGWREANGRLCQYLAREAAEVHRIFCGLEQRLK